MKKSIENKGITLVALVITIIVLLILAGVTISLVVGDNGILTRAKDSKITNEKAGIYEQISLATSNGEMEYYANGTDRLIAYRNALLSEVNGIDANSLTDNGTDLITGTVIAENGKQYDFTVPVPGTGITLVEHQEEPPVVLENTITSDDYGKPVNYSVTVNGTILDNWKIFLNDGGNVYIIYGDYLEAALAPEDSRMSKDPDNYMYAIGTSWQGNYLAYEFCDYLLDNTVWESFAAGVLGASATGSPTLLQLNRSLGRNDGDGSSINGANQLYLPKTEIFNQCNGYWLADAFMNSSSNYLKYVRYDGYVGSIEDAMEEFCCVRPLVKLPSGITGTVGMTVVIK